MYGDSSKMKFWKRLMDPDSVAYSPLELATTSTSRFAQGQALLPRPRVILYASTGIIYLVTLVMAFTFGKWSTISVEGLIVPVSIVSHTLRYNRTFSLPPNNYTNDAWRTIYPKFGTFFTHVPGVPERSTISVFHQLHCLDGIRHAYYRAMHAALEGNKLDEATIPEMESQPHIVHCIDLLRQSLMCNADRTVEVKDEKGGVRGFGTTHQCVDWDKLTGLIDTWNTK